MFNEFDRSPIDLDTSRGLHLFRTASAKQAAYEKGRGLGHWTEKQLLRRVASSGEWLSPSDRSYLEALAATRRASGLGTLEEAARALLVRERRNGSRHATELLNRFVDDPDGNAVPRPGEYDSDAAREYFRISASEAHEAGFMRSARHYERMSLYPLAGELLAPEHCAMKLEHGARLGARPKAARRNTVKALDRLLRFERSVLERGEHSRDAVIDEMAQAEGRPRKLFVKSLTDARNARAKRHAN